MVEDESVFVIEDKGEIIFCDVILFYDIKITNIDDNRIRD